jgi:hypothetical protein
MFTTFLVTSHVRVGPSARVLVTLSLLLYRGPGEVPGGREDLVSLEV